VEIERLVCHPRLPLVAGLDAARPAVCVLDGELRELAVIGRDARPYCDDDRELRTPTVTWHPYEPVLMVPTGEGVIRWSPRGVTTVVADAYFELGFSPDGRSLLAMRPPSDEDESYRSDVIDLASGAVGVGPGWDTGVVVHPAGEIVAMLNSDQAETLVVFARVEGTALRLFRRALTVDVDGYTAPVFSPDGRYFAMRGNAYVHTLDVYAFPSLRRVLHHTLGEWDTDWTLYNVAFGSRPGRLFVGTPGGTLVEWDLERREVVEHEVAPGSVVTAVGARADGSIVVAFGAELRVFAQPPVAAAEVGTVRDFLATADAGVVASGADAAD
jgi:hypothetical protein